MTNRSGPLRIVGLSGSLREDSTNTAVLRAARDLAPADAEVRVLVPRDVPLFDVDLEVGGLPAPVARLREAVAAADGLLLATPEYNWSVSGSLKNAIDWLSRGDPAPLDRKPAALLSAGGSGGVRAQAHLREILGHNRVDVLDTAVQVPHARHHVVDGELATAAHRRAVAELVAALCAHIRRHAQPVS